MAIKTYKKGSTAKLSANFGVHEFACKGSKCGCNTVLIDEKLVIFVQKIRDHFGKPTTITSGYRCSKHNKSVGGATASRHAKGQAADIKVEGVAPAEVAKYAESIGVKGIGLYETAKDGYFVHIDTRTTKAFWYGQKQAKRTTFGGSTATTKPAEEPKTEEPKKETGANEMAYKDITEVPEWGRKSVQLRIDHGWTDGKNITESMVRCWVIEDRENPYISELKDVPAWAVPEVKALMAAGKIKGNSVEQIGKRWQVIEALIMASR